MVQSARNEIVSKSLVHHKDIAVILLISALVHLDTLFFLLVVDVHRLKLRQSIEDFALVIIIGRSGVNSLTARQSSSNSGTVDCVGNRINLLLSCISID